MSRRYGDKPHGGRKDSLEFDPDSVGSIPRSTQIVQKTRFAAEEGRDEKCMEGGREPNDRIG
jgi:hypothetical protein